jgi:hypothetical protein
VTTLIAHTKHNRKKVSLWDTIMGIWDHILNAGTIETEAQQFPTNNLMIMILVETCSGETFKNFYRKTCYTS